MNGLDETLFGIAFSCYLGTFFLYILHLALKKEVLGKISTGLSMAGLIPHSIALGYRWILSGHVPLANMYEYMGLMSWMVILGMIIFIFRYKNMRIGIFMSPIAIMLMVTASLLPSEVNSQLMPALQSTWLAIHVSMAALGTGAFLISFSSAALYLLTAAPPDAIKAKKKEELKSNVSWVFYLVAWIGIPLVVMLILKIIGALPPSISGGMHSPNGGPYTIFAFGNPSDPTSMGQQAIGLGIGLFVAAIVWPMIHKRYVQKTGNPVNGVRWFIVIVIALLVSALIAGFLVKGRWIQLTPGSYFKIFEFFGPVLVLSWFIAPLVQLTMGNQSTGWLHKIGVSRPLLEDISYAAVAIGYPLYTVGALFAGAIWAEQAWGTWWSWDPKEVGALIIWLFYTVFLHARYQRQWKGNRAAILIVLGMMMVFVSFFGNYFFGGMHSFEVT